MKNDPDLTVVTTGHINLLKAIETGRPQQLITQKVQGTLYLWRDQSAFINVNNMM